MLRNRTWAILVGLGALLNTVPVYPYLFPNAVFNPSTSFASEPPGASFRVLLANVQASNDQAEGLVEIIDTSSPDVIAIVEYNDQWGQRLAALEPNYPHRVVVADEGNFGIAVLSRWPIAVTQVIDIAGTAAIDVEIDREGHTFAFLATHLVPPISAAMAAQRQRQLAVLTQRILADRNPLIVVGDFNLSPFSPYFSKFIADTKLKDALRGNGPAITWPTFFPLLGIPIDHCLVSAHFSVENYYRAGSYGSDHFPIIVDLVENLLK